MKTVEARRWKQRRRCGGEGGASAAVIEAAQREGGEGGSGAVEAEAPPVRWRCARWRTVSVEPPCIKLPSRRDDASVTTHCASRTGSHSHPTRRHGDSRICRCT